MKEKPKVTLRRTDDAAVGAQAGSAMYRVERITGAVTVPYRNTDDPQKPHTAQLRAGAVIDEDTAATLLMENEVTTLAPA